MKASERLTMAAALGLVVVTAIARPEGARLRVCVFLAIAGLTLLLARAQPRPLTDFIRDWVPVAELVVVYLLLQPIIEAVAPWRLDDVLAAFDDRWLGWLVEPWRNALGRPAWLTDLTYAAYCSYYLLPIVVAAAAWRRSPQAFERTAFVLLLVFYLTFLGYLCLPASGPRLDAAVEARVVGGGGVSDAVRAFLRSAETTTLDAFPSGHTAVAVIAAMLAWRLVAPATGVALWTWAAMVVFATVYVHVHYAVDVIAGLALAGVAAVACRRWRTAGTGRS